MGLPVEVNNLMMGSLGGYTVGRSLRFRNSASAYLNRTPPSAGNRRTWTFSFWAKLANMGTGNRVLSTYTASTDQDRILLGDSLLFATSVGGTQYTVGSNNLFRDPSAWYHFIVSVDTTQATTNNRMRLYVNGNEVSYGTQTMPPQNTQLNINNTISHWISGYNGTSELFGGYLAEVNFIDGQQLTPSSFGAYDTNGVWQPKKYSGSYGTNGFYLPFSNTTSTTTLVQDSSGNGNNWTPNNISLTAGTTYDSMTDSPTVSAISSNYAVLNPIDTGSSGSVSAGNLTHSSSGGGVTRSNASIRVPSSGKFYAEFINSSATNSNIGLGFGVSADSVALNAAYNAANSYHFYASNAAQAMNSGTLTSISSWTNSANQTFQLAVDVDNSKVWIGQNNVWWDSAGGTTGNPSTGANPTFTVSTSEFKIFTSIDTTSSVNWIANFGQRPFAYTPPSGFKALNTYNLPAPSIANGAQYMAATVFSASGSSQVVTNTVNNTSFQTDFLWLKNRTSAGNHYLADVIRGPSNLLYSDATSAEGSAPSFITSFNSNGFTINTNGVYTNGNSIVGWQWKGGGTGVTNTAGSITSTVSASPSSGFSIVRFTGNAVNGATVGHGLGVVPSMLFIKNRTQAGSWIGWHKSISQSIQTSTTFQLTGYTGAIFLNLTNGSSTYGFDQQINGNGNSFVAYCWSEVAGYSKFGSYTGNGSADGPFVFTNFRPRFLLVKRTDTVESWNIVDTSRNDYNQAGANLYPDLTNAESNNNLCDLLSNGFKIRNTWTGANASGGTYIYAAFAENPFNTSRAR